jgi:hypothetical protein
MPQVRVLLEDESQKALKIRMKRMQPGRADMKFAARAITRPHAN